MQKYAINGKKELMLENALLINLEAMMQNWHKWCQNLHFTEKTGDMIEKLEVETEVLVKGRMRLKGKVVFG